MQAALKVESFLPQKLSLRFVEKNVGFPFLYYSSFVESILPVPAQPLPRHRWNFSLIQCPLHGTKDCS